MHDGVCKSVLLSQFISLSPPPSPCPHAYSVCLCLYFCPANRFICTIFLGVCNGIWLYHNKEQNWVTCRDVVEPRLCHTEWSQKKENKFCILTNLYIYMESRKMLYFWDLAVLVGVKWHLLMVLNCIFLMANDAEHLFIYLFSLCVSLEKCLWKPFVQFLALFIF